MATYDKDSVLQSGRPWWKLEGQQQLADGRWTKIARVTALSPEGGWADIAEDDGITRRVHGSFRAVDSETGEVNPALVLPSMPTPEPEEPEPAVDVEEAVPEPRR